MSDYEDKIKKWYSSPGEVMRSIGFYINPYKIYDQAQFRHIFAVDGDYNLYVAQHSIYQKHLDEIFDLKDKREFGIIYPLNSPVRPKDNEKLCDSSSVIDFEFMETSNIVYFNRRLKPICQRFYDYGLSPETYIINRKLDLWFLTIKDVLKGKYLERPNLDN